MTAARHLCFGVLGTLAALAAAPAPAQITRPSRTTVGTYVPGSMGIPQPEPRITLSVRQRSLGRIMAEVFRQTPYQYQILAGQGTTLVYNVEARNTPLTQVLRSILAQDRSPEPLVFSFSKSLAGVGVFTFHREFVEVEVREGEARVSAANARITSVLPQIFDKMKVAYRIESDVPPVLISLQLRPQEWSHALAQVILEAYKLEPGLTYSIDGETYVVHLQKTPTTLAAAGARRITLAINNLPLRDALGELFKDSSWKYQISDKVKDVPISYTTQTDTEIGALHQILKQADLKGTQVTYREGKGMLYIEPGPLPGEARVLARGAVGREPLASLTITQRLRMVIQFLADQTGAMVRVAPTVPDLPVTVNIKNATIEEALLATVEAARASLPNLTVRKMGEVFIVELDNKG